MHKDVTEYQQFHLYDDFCLLSSKYCKGARTEMQGVGVGIQYKADISETFHHQHSHRHLNHHNHNHFYPAVIVQAGVHKFAQTDLHGFDQKGSKLSF